MNKKTFVRLFIVALVLVFMVDTFFRGKSGYLKYFKLKKDMSLKKRSIEKLNKKIVKIKKDIKHINNDPFEIEKSARLDLQMGEKDEVVYLLDK